MRLDRNNPKLRLYILATFIIGVYSVFFLRLVDLQVIKHDDFVLEARKQYQITLADTFNRGSVYFLNKSGDHILAADIQESKIKKDDKEIVERNRIYPLGDLGSKVLGFVAYDKNTRKGQYGIEKYYDDVLSRDSSKLYTNFFAEMFTDIKGNIMSNKEVYEGDVVLTVDIEVQRALHKILKETQEEWGSDNIGAIVMDPNDGRIIAMEELPTFDGNDFSKVTNFNLYKNDLVSGVYEMGSIIKPITMAAALDAGVVDEDTTYNDLGVRNLDGYKVRNYDGKARGVVGIQKILDQSLNVGIVFLVEKLGGERLADYFKKFGIGEESGIDLPNEASGLTRNLDSKVFVDSATAGFGQGIAITPIQTIRALAMLGNGGKLVNPYIVDSWIYENGITKKNVPDEGEQVLNSGTSERISRMLVHVVDTALQGGKWKKDHYTLAAKTGTAQIPRPGGGYYEDRYLHSFFGYFPAYQPKYIVFIYHTYPKGAEYASQTLTKPFYAITDFLISYYGVQPDR
jgi:cell division protein FtsI (penicillin-binding protein 3)/stage V sporulation protein D (sporulation-specific penicillin-binding protein)